MSKTLVTSMTENLPSPDVTVAHSASLGTLLATMVGWLPIFFALVPAIYYCVLIWESDTVQKWRKRRRHHRALRRRLKSAQAKVKR